MLQDMMAGPSATPMVQLGVSAGGSPSATLVVQLGVRSAGGEPKHEDKASQDQHHVAQHVMLEVKVPTRK
jgi:hypothetical protein